MRGIVAKHVHCSTSPCITITVLHTYNTVTQLERFRYFVAFFAAESILVESYTSRVDILCLWTGQTSSTN